MVTQHTISIVIYPNSVRLVCFDGEIEFQGPFLKISPEKCQHFLLEGGV